MILLKNRDVKAVLLLCLLGFCCFQPNIGAVHLFDWDEINFAESAREMILTGDYFRPQIDFEPFWEKPPLFIWMQVLSMKAFGITEFAARFPNVICGMLTLLFVYFEGRRYANEAFGASWVMAFVCSLLPSFYFRSGIIDPWFNLFIFSGLWYFFRGHRHMLGARNSGKWILVGGLLCGLGVLTKGPVAYLMSGLTVALLFLGTGFNNWRLIQHFALFSLAAFVPAALWFGADIYQNGPWFTREFLTYNVRLASTQDSGHGGFWGYHFVVLLFGCFPASIFALRQLFTLQKEARQAQDFTTTWVQILFWAVLILFSIVQTKIVHYSSLAYYPLTFLAAKGIASLVRKRDISGWHLIVFSSVSLLLIAVWTAFPYVGNHIELIRPLFERDAFAKANLNGNVEWSNFQYVAPFLALLSLIISIQHFAKKDMRRGAEYGFGIGFALLIFGLSGLVSRIEPISQGAAIEFYESKQDEKCYVVPVGFKSFAHLFYTKKPPVNGDKTVDDRQVLLENSTTDRPVYFVTKITNMGGLDSRDDMIELYRKNGFVFFKRK